MAPLSSFSSRLALPLLSTYLTTAHQAALAISLGVGLGVGEGVGLGKSGLGLAVTQVLQRVREESERGGGTVGGMQEGAKNLLTTRLLGCGVPSTLRTSWVGGDGVSTTVAYYDYCYYCYYCYYYYYYYYYYRRWYPGGTGCHAVRQS